MLGNILKTALYICLLLLAVKIIWPLVAMVAGIFGFLLKLAFIGLMVMFVIMWIRSITKKNE